MCHRELDSAITFIEINHIIIGNSRKRSQKKNEFIIINFFGVFTVYISIW